MSKAILELEMPESCIKCKLLHFEANADVMDRCIITDSLVAQMQNYRNIDCPLKLVEGCEYCNTEHNKFLTDDVYLATTNSYGDKNRVITSRDGLQYKTIRYCPMCGRKLEVEP